MKVVIDTTVLGRDSALSSSDAQLLKVYLRGTQSELCVPKVVIEEAVNLVRKSVITFNKAAQDAARLSRDRRTFAPVDLESSVSEYRTKLDSVISAFHGQILPFPKVDHERILTRALSNRKPFVEGGRGYKDTLIWFTIVELLQACEDEVLLISANYKDWGREREQSLLDITFWEDLSHLNIRANRMHLAQSLSEFNEKYTLKTLMEVPPEERHLYSEPDYRQILLDGHDFVKAEMPSALSGILWLLSRTDPNPLPVALLSLSLPTSVESHRAPRIIEGAKRVLQFSAEYIASVEVPLPSGQPPTRWEQLSYHVVRDAENGGFRANVTLKVRANFHMIQDGENTESFSFGLQTDTGSLESLKVK